MLLPHLPATSTRHHVQHLLFLFYLQEWNRENHNDAEALFGVEDVFARDPGAGSSGWGVSSGRFGVQFEQWTLAGAPHHPVYCNMHGFIR